MNDRKPRLPKGTLEWLSQVAMRAPAPGYPNISVRGTRSLEALAHYGFDKHAVVLGCPSLFINPNPELGASIAKRLGRINRIAVAAGHQEWTELATLEASLARIVTRTGGSYIAQSEFEMMALARADFAQLSRADLLACRDYVAPEMDLDEFVQWSHRYATVFFHVPAWIEHYRHFDFVIGTRIHGVMLALQAGTPALCITHDSRTLEFCQSMGLPYVEASEVARGIDIGDIRDLYKFDAAEFDRNRRSLGKRYVEFLVQNGLHVSEALRPFA
jgi:polysaccharide pyruvyl transferase WcaK-like protein